MEVFTLRPDTEAQTTWGCELQGSRVALVGRGQAACSELRLRQRPIVRVVMGSRGEAVPEFNHHIGDLAGRSLVGGLARVSMPAIPRDHERATGLHLRSNHRMQQRGAYGAGGTTQGRRERTQVESRAEVDGPTLAWARSRCPAFFFEACHG